MFWDYNQNLMNILTFLSLWALLFFGLLAKTKGFKVANGIFSIGFLFMSVIGILNLVITLLENNPKSNIDFSMLVFNFLTFILVLILSIYVTYATLLNKDFKLIYLNKEDVTNKVKKTWQVLAIIIISYMFYITILDIGI
jgi:hypothetical protein|tara:strand:- start:159 stop:578 length:420 start_codon:yes stop_codon:yes gene_type:complete